ncbi:MAG: DNA-directed RNA polymerase subunit alpha [Elusimicrobiota bacterium]
MSNSDMVVQQKLTPKEQTDFYGKFICEPFEPGYGHTIGNSLRRILLSSLEGAAITACKLRGGNQPWVRHEYDTINHIKEDVMGIILNLKKIRLKMYSKGPEILTLEVKGEKIVRAKDIKENPNVEILNPDVVIATLSGGGSLEIECEVNRGRGYHIAEENKKPYHSAEIIPVDSLFSPIIKTHYEVENARVGQRTDYDRLIVEIWTDGSIVPADALAYSAKILQDTLNVFMGSRPKEQKYISPIEVIQQEKIKEFLEQPIEVLGLSSRPFNCLQQSQIKLLKDLVIKKSEEIANLRNLGKKSLDEIKEKLAEHNLSFGMQLAKDEA